MLVNDKLLSVNGLLESMMLISVENLDGGPGTVRITRSDELEASEPASDRRSLLFSPTLEKLLSDNIRGYVKGDIAQRNMRDLIARVYCCDRREKMKPDDGIVVIAKDEAIRSFMEVTEQDVLILKRYLGERDPEEQLKCLKEILDELYKNLVSHFDVRDILLRVGDPRVNDLAPFPLVGDE